MDIERRKQLRKDVFELLGLKDVLNSWVSKLHMHGCGPNQHGSDPKQNYKLKTDQHPGSRLSTGWPAHAVQIQTALQRL